MNRLIPAFPFLSVWKLVAIGAVALSVLAAAARSASAQAEAAGKQRWAIIAAAANTSGLADLLQPTQGLDREVAAIRDVLKASREKLAVSVDRRRLIGVMPIKTEEPGGHLKPFCHTLTTLVEVELHAQPQNG